MKKIGIDFDDIILNLSDHLLDFFNERFNSNFKREDIKQYQMGVLWNLTRPQEEELIMEFCLSELHHGCMPVKGALEAIQELSKENTLMIVSARRDELLETTHKWLDQNLPDVFHSIIFTNSHHSDLKKRVKKSVICKQYGVEIFIDDSMAHIQDVSPVVKKSFLLDTPWNQGDIPQNAERAFSWEEIIRNIKAEITPSASKQVA